MFWKGLKQVFPLVLEFFTAKLGDGSLFQYWLDDWLAQSPLSVKFSLMFTLTWNPCVIVSNRWNGKWNPTLEGTLLEQWLDTLLNFSECPNTHVTITQDLGWLGMGRSHVPTLMGVSED